MTNDELRALAKEYGVELRISTPPVLDAKGEVMLLPGIRKLQREDPRTEESSTR